MKSKLTKALILSMLGLDLLLMPSYVFAEEITTNNEQIISNETNTNDHSDKTLESSELNVETSNLLVNDEKDVHNINQEDNEIIEEVPAKLTSFTIEESGYVGTDYTLSSSGNSVNGVEYKYHLKDYGTNKWIILQEYSDTSSHTWTPQKIGKYRVVVHIRDKNSSKEYDAYIYRDIEVKEVPPAKLTSFTIKEGGYVGTNYSLSSSGNSVNGAEYRYHLKDYETNKWTVLQDYSEVSNHTWMPQKTGKYRMVVHVRDKNSSKEYEAYTYKDIEVRDTEITKFNINDGKYLGQEYKIETLGGSTNGVDYKYHLKDYETNKWTVLQDYSDVNNYTWVPQKTGKYRLVVHVRDKNSSKEYDAYIYRDMEVKEVPPAKLTSFTIKEGGYVGTNYTLSSSGNSVNGVEYRYHLKDYETNKWTRLQDYSKVNNYTWLPQKAGKYRVVVHMRDKNSSKEYEAYKYKDIEVKEVPPSNLTNFTIKEGGYIGTNYSLSSNGNSVNGVEYRYHLKDYETNKWTILQDYSDVNNYTWVPQKAGKYRVVVHIRDKKGLKDFEVFDYKDVYVEDSLQIIYSNYDTTLKQQLEKQMKANPQTDYYDGNWKDAKDSEVRYFLDPNNFTKDRVDSVRINIASANLNMYSEPINGYVIRTLGKGEVYPIIDEKYGWYKILAKNRIGWVSGGQIELTTMTNNQKFQFLDISKPSNISVIDLNKFLKDKGQLEGQGNAFKNASKTHGINEIYLISHAFLETGNGGSSLSKGVKVDSNGSMVDRDGRLINSHGNFVDSKGNKVNSPIIGEGEFTIVYNMFGIGAYDDNPTMHGAKRAFNEGWTSPKAAIVGGADFVSKYYVYNDTHQQNTLYKMRWNPANPYSYATHQYATDVGWVYKQVNLMKQYYDLCSNYVLYFDIPIYK